MGSATVSTELIAPKAEMGRRLLVAIAIIVGVSTFTPSAAPDDRSAQELLGLSAEFGEGAPFNDGTNTGDRPTGGVQGEGVPLARGTAAIEALGFDWATLLPEWTIEFREGRDDLFGLTHTQENRIEVFVRDDQTDEFLQHVIAHELGHAIDVTLNSTEDRERWQQERGIADVDWWPGSGATDFATGAGDFAEAFAVWLTGPDGYRSELGEAPNLTQLDLVAELSES